MEVDKTFLDTRRGMIGEKHGWENMFTSIQVTENGFDSGLEATFYIENGADLMAVYRLTKVLEEMLGARK